MIHTRYTHNATFRRNFLHSFIHAIGDARSFIDVHNLAFLYAHEMSTGVYHFVPGPFGPYSFALERDKRSLIKAGVLEDRTDFRLTEPDAAPRGNDFLEAMLLSGFSRRAQSIQDPLRKIAVDFPHYAVRADLNRLNLTEGQETRVRTLTPPVRGPGLLTVGYEKKSLEEVLFALYRENVSVLVDVRRNPISRKAGFSKTALTQACGLMGIRYAPARGLGIASEARRSIKTAEEREELLNRYSAALQCKSFEGRLEDLRWMAGRERVALLCFERHACECHRGRIVDALGMEALHL